MSGAPQLMISVPVDRVSRSARRRDIVTTLACFVVAALAAVGIAAVSHGSEFGAFAAMLLVIAAITRLRIVAEEGRFAPIRGRGALVVRPDGLAPSDEIWIPEELFGGVFIGSWVRPERGPVNSVSGLVIRLTDGREVPVGAVRRETHRERSDREVVLRDGDGAPRLLVGRSGALLAWSALTDAEVAERLEVEIRAVLNLGAATAAGRPLQLPRKLPKATSVRPIPERGPDGRYVASGAGQPESEGLTTPTAYRSRATQRVRRPSWVRFNADGIVLHDRKRHEAFHLTEVADFDVAPDLDGISRLSLVLADGTLRDLPGVMHGLWATNPLLIGNELQWWHAPEPVGEPDGTLPWGSDDDPLILARLRAHLASVQTTAGLPVTPAVP